MSAAIDNRERFSITLSHSFRISNIDLFGLFVAYGVHFPSQPMPCHDPPAAWRFDDLFAGEQPLPIVCCPAVPFDHVAIGQLPEGVPVLDGEPGRA